jgi:hypothetical protein
MAGGEPLPQHEPVDGAEEGVTESRGLTNNRHHDALHTFAQLDAHNRSAASIHVVIYRVDQGKAAKSTSRVGSGWILQPAKREGT